VARNPLSQMVRIALSSLLSTNVLLDFVISCGLMGFDGIVRTIKAALEESFSDLVSQVRSKLGIETEPIILSYYFAWGQKSRPNTLENEDEWDALKQVAMVHHKRKLSGPHMVTLLCTKPQHDQNQKGKDIDTKVCFVFVGIALNLHYDSRIPSRMQATSLIIAKFLQNISASLVTRCATLQRPRMG
jgi:hypothetical protein